MNKAEFIAELDSRIAVLAEDERRDILDEYEQHIDIKVMRGMSEEDAIADFGRMEELVADILEAYHVRADYADPKREKKEPQNITERLLHGRLFKKDGAEEPDAKGRQSKESWFEGKPWQRVRNICSRIAGFCKKAVQNSIDGVKGLGRSVQKGAGIVIDFCKKPFVRRRKARTEEIVLPKGVDDSGRKGKRKMRKEAGFSVMGAIRAMLDACAAAVMWCLKWMWNLFWLGSGALFGFGSCIVIFFMGTLAVLLALGYPLRGIAIGCLGLVLCMSSVTVWCFSLIIGKRRLKREADTDRAPARMAKEDEVQVQETAKEEEKEEEESAHA